MPNSLKCRLKKFVEKGLLSEKDLSRIYTDNDIIKELEKIKDKVEWEAKGQDEAWIKAWKVLDMLDERISKLKRRIK